MSLKSIPIIAFGFFLILLPRSVSALKMESQRYFIQSEEISEVQPNDPTANNEQQLSADDQKKFNDQGYVATSNSDTFMFSLDTATVSLGSTLPKTVTVSNKLHVRSSNGYQVNVSETAPLHSITGDAIPNTGCDNVCSYLHAAKWTTSTTTGFGYTVLGSDTADDFIDRTFFRAFADESKHQRSSVILKSSQIKAVSNNELVLKLNTTNSTQNVSTIINVQAFPTY